VSSSWLARYAIPAISSSHFFFEVGGLITYAPDALDGYRQTGVYTGRVLSGVQPRHFLGTRSYAAPATRGLFSNRLIMARRAMARTGLCSRR
jgi:ABC-type uncharacterized transport system substrate-binding protein